MKIKHLAGIVAVLSLVTACGAAGRVDGGTLSGPSAAASSAAGAAEPSSDEADAPSGDVAPSAITAEGEGQGKSSFIGTFVVKYNGNGAVDGGGTSVRGCGVLNFTRSFSGAVADNLTIQNLAAVPVSVFWLNYSGQPVFYTTIPPKMQYGLRTYASHPWVLVENNTCKNLFVMP